MEKSRLKETIAGVAPSLKEIEQRAFERLDRLTKPPGSLGFLEELAARYAAARHAFPPVLNKKRVYTFAADHGVTEEGVSAFPREVTRQMVLNFLARGAAINVLAGHAGAEVVVVDVGVDAEFEDLPGLVKRKVRAGTANMARGPAMSREEAVEALMVGVDMAEASFGDGVDALVPGEMGIGNTTAAAAVLCTFTGLDPEEVAGLGTGITEDARAGKVGVIRKSLELNSPDPADPVAALAGVGGLEIAAMAGLILGAARRRIAVALDGFISTAAAFVALGLAPDVKDYLFLGHLSEEKGHRAAAGKLGLRPILDLGMRLGEGTGGCLALMLIEAGVKIINEMATFESAGVSGRG